MGLSKKFQNLVTFSLKNLKYVIKFFPFYIYISYFCKFSHPKKKKLVMTCKFECFQSHYHILKELHESFLVTYGLVTKSFGGCVYNLGYARENKMS